MDKNTKIKIFAEYLGQECIKESENRIETLTIDNIERLVDDGYKLSLKSVYDLSEEEMFEVAEEMRYNKALQELFRDFSMKHFRMSSESRNKANLGTAMISYVADTNDGLKGNWFRLIGSYGYKELSAKGYDVGSCWAYTMNGKFKDRKSLEEIGLAIIKSN
jgi:hypothetical protein